MRTLAELAKLAEIYVKRTGVKPSRLGLEACGNAGIIDRLLKGKGCLAENAEQLSLWFDRNWPFYVAWPAQVSLPPDRSRSELQRPRRPRRSARPATPPLLQQMLTD